MSKGLSEGKPPVYLCAQLAKFHTLGLRAPRFFFISGISKARGESGSEGILKNATPETEGLAARL